MGEILNDELQIYRGKDFLVKPGINIHQPTLDEICDYGEKRYWGMIQNICSVGSNLKFQLWDLGVDYTKIGDFELFYSLICKSLLQEDTEIIFGDLDFQKFNMYIVKKNNVEEPVLYDAQNDILIDDYTYTIITDILRRMHGLKKDCKIPANESTKMILIEDARDEYNLNKDKEWHSQLKNLISAMINSEGFKYNHNEIWNMKIHAFMDSVQRILKIKNADLLLQSGYSGFGINLKEINKKQLDWTGELL